MFEQIRSFLAPAALAAVFMMIAAAPATSQNNPPAAPAAKDKPAAPAASSAPAAPSGEAAVQPVSLRIAVIDVDSIRVTAKVVNNIAQQINKYRETFQEEINKEEVKLRDAQEELKKQEAILAEDAFKENVQKFQKEIQEAQVNVQQRKQQLGKTQAESMRKVELALNKIIDELVKEFDLHMVLRREPVVYYNPGLDLTKMVLERLDKEMPSLKVPPIEDAPKPEAKKESKPASAKPEAKPKSPPPAK